MTQSDDDKLMTQSDDRSDDIKWWQNWKHKVITHADDTKW